VIAACGEERKREKRKQNAHPMKGIAPDTLLGYSKRLSEK
jgi:hypothetical protein